MLHFLQIFNLTKPSKNFNTQLSASMTKCNIYVLHYVIKTQSKLIPAAVHDSCYLQCF